MKFLIRQLAGILAVFFLVSGLHAGGYWYTCANGAGGATVCAAGQYGCQHGLDGQNCDTGCSKCKCRGGYGILVNSWCDCQ